MIIIFLDILTPCYLMGRVDENWLRVMVSGEGQMGWHAERQFSLKGGSSGWNSLFNYG